MKRLYFLILASIIFIPYNHAFAFFGGSSKDYFPYQNKMEYHFNTFDFGKEAYKVKWLFDGKKIKIANDKAVKQTKIFYNVKSKKEKKAIYYMASDKKGIAIIGTFKPGNDRIKDTNIIYKDKRYVIKKPYKVGNKWVNIYEDSNDSSMVWKEKREIVKVGEAVVTPYGSLFDCIVVKSYSELIFKKNNKVHWKYDAQSYYSKKTGLVKFVMKKNRIMLLTDIKKQ